MGERATTKTIRELTAGVTSGTSDRRGEELYRFVCDQRPHRSRELGFASGVSTLYMASALEANGVGHITSVDTRAALVRQPRSVALLERAGIGSSAARRSTASVASCGVGNGCLILSADGNSGRTIGTAPLPATTSSVATTGALDVAPSILYAHKEHRFCSDVPIGSTVPHREHRSRPISREGEGARRGRPFLAADQIRPAATQTTRQRVAAITTTARRVRQSEVHVFRAGITVRTRS